jgi:hypothetical protein
VVSDAQSVDAAKWPCGVYRNRVGDGSIVYNSYWKWIHRRCTGVKGILKNDGNFRRSVCVIGDHRNAGHMEVVVDVTGSVEWVESLCYLGDVMSCGG